MDGYSGPRFWFRYLNIKSLIKDSKFKNVLEIGPGNLNLTKLFADYSKRVEALDLSDQIHTHYKSLDSRYKKIIVPKDGDFLTKKFDKTFDLIVASEVLEHIENADNFIEKINSISSNIGQIIITVPAKMSLWSKHDEAVGHVKRYEKNELKKLSEKLNASSYKIISYGYPWTSLLRLARILTVKKVYSDYEKASEEEKTIVSGGNSNKNAWLKNFKLLSNNKIIYPFYLFSRLFNTFDLANGYILYISKGE